MASVTGYKLIFDTGAPGVSLGDPVSDGGQTTSIDTAASTPSHQVSVAFDFGTPVTGFMYSEGADYYFVPDGPMDSSPLGFGIVVDLQDIGENVILGDCGDDALQGDVEGNTILGGQGSDTLEGGEGDDLLYGGAGHDLLLGGTGDDTLRGGGSGENATEFEDPILLLNFEDGIATAAADDSGNGHDGIYQGGAAAGGSGWTGSSTGVILDGSNGYVEIPDSSDFDLAEGTISIRFNAEMLDGYLVSRDSSGFDGGGHLGISVNADGSISVRIQDTGQSYSFESDTGLVSTGQWHHVALSFGSDGAHLYIDGEVAATHSYTGGIAGNDEPWVLGVNQWASGDGVADNLNSFFDGTLDEFAVFDAQLSAEGVEVLRTSGAENVPAPAASNDATQLVTLNFENGDGPAVTDDSGNGNDAMLHGSVTTGGTGWDGTGSAVHLDGQDAYVEVPDDGAFDLSEGTIAIRFKTDDLEEGVLVSRDSSGYDGGGHVKIELGEDGELSVRLQDDSNSYRIDTDEDLVSEGQWHHVALTFGSDGMRLYLDGVEVGSNAYSGGIVGNDEPWTLGADQQRSGDGVADRLENFFEGELDEFALIEGQLTPEQISVFATNGIGALAPGLTGDSLVGGDGADTFLINDAFGQDTIVGGEGGSDGDAVDLSALSSGATVTYSGDEAGTIVDGTDSLSFSQVEALTLTEQDDSVDASQDNAGVRVEGGAGSDTIIGGSGSDLIEGGKGDDLLRTGLGQDTLLGGSGDDTLMNSEGDDSLVGGAGDDSIVASGGDDTLEGGAGNDTLIGGDDNDRLVGGIGNDLQDGGADADTFILEDGFGSDTIIGGEGGTDLDTLDFSALTVPVTVTYTGFESGTVTDGADTLSFSEIENLVLTDYADLVNNPASWSASQIDAGGGDDTILSGGGHDTVLGGTGADSIEGRGGDDSISGGTGSDTLVGQDGHDTLSGDAGADTLSGHAGDDVLHGGGDGDVLYGDEGSDTLYGGDGDDTLVGAHLTDELYGEGGDDTFLLQSTYAWGSDTIVGGETDETGGDTIDASEVTTSVTVTYAGNEAGTITDGSDINTFTEIEGFTLTDQADAFDASASSLAVTVDAGGGADTVTGGSGDDSIATGAGDDIVVLNQSGGHDVILDFDIADTDGNGATNDQLDVSGLLDGEGNPVNIWDVTVTDDGSGNAVLTFPEGEAVTLQGIAPAQMTGPQMAAMGIPCFTPGTMILTANGEVPVEDLKIGDMVATRDHGHQPIRYISTEEICGPRIPDNHLPILIPAGSLGFGLPERNLFVSGQHRMLLDWRGARQLYDTAEVLAPAKALVQLPGVRVKRDVRNVRYMHIVFDRHEVIFAEGAPTESFYPGPTTLRSLDFNERDALFCAFPALRNGVEAALGAPARRLLRVQETKQFVRDYQGRHGGEVAKWDVDLAMERYETELLFGEGGASAA
ncbi:MAG: Hint domain-containing protein [Rhodobacter sp.]|nr:Hint domain-containing protein [Rhodobacter sp.]